MKLLGEKTYTVTRYGATDWSTGLPVSAVASTFTIRASIQPVRGFELQMLQEGELSGGSHKCYTTAELLVQAEGQRGDTLEYRGRTLKVMACLDYGDHTTGLPHRRYLLGDPGVDGR